MSYYKLKSVGFQKSAGKIFVTVADSSLRPLTYFRVEYAQNVKNFAEKCKCFWVDVFNGNIRMTKSNRWYIPMNDAVAQMKRIANGEDIFSSDLEYRTQFHDELIEYVTDTYLVPLMTKEEKDPNPTYENDFIERCHKEWECIAEKRQEDGIVSVRSALRSNIFPGRDVLFDGSENRTIVAKCKNYNRGLLDDSDKTAIFLPKDSGNDWAFIAYAAISDVPEILRKYPELIHAITFEATYLYEERAEMDGYKKLDGISWNIYYSVNDSGRVSYAEVMN